MSNASVLPITAIAWIRKLPGLEKALCSTTSSDTTDSRPHKNPAVIHAAMAVEASRKMKPVSAGGSSVDSRSSASRPSAAMPASAAPKNVASVAGSSQSGMPTQRFI